MAKFLETLIAEWLEYQGYFVRRNQKVGIGELIDAALSPQAPEPDGRREGPFRVIDGGRYDGV